MSKKPEMNPKHPGGRPTKYRPEYCAALVKFFAIPAYSTKPIETSREYFANGTLRKESTKSRLIPSSLPTLYRFSKEVGVHRDTLHQWAKDHTEFSDAIKEAKELQKEFLIALGLAGAAPPASYIFTAKNITDMRDKQEVESTKTFDVKGLEQMKDHDLDELIEALQNRAGRGVARKGAKAA